MKRLNRESRDVCVCVLWVCTDLFVEVADQEHSTRSRMSRQRHPPCCCRRCCCCTQRADGPYRERRREEGPCQLTQPRRAYSSASQADLPCGHAFYLSAPTTPSTCSYAAHTTHLWQTHISESISAARQIAIWTDFTQTGTLEQYPNKIAFWALSAHCS